GSVAASFDIDRGYQAGDPIFWLSLLKLFNSSGDLLAQGPGFSNPLTGGAGSSSWLDDYLTYTFTQTGHYNLEVGVWVFTTGLPNGVDYDLQVSIQNHHTDGFVFSPSPVLEDERGNDVSPGQAVVDDDFFTFFDQLVGNTWAGGTIDWQTPYARIIGAGDGSF